MKNSEAIEVLALARVGKSTEGKLYDSLEHAIKCVELMPELITSLEISKERINLFCLDGETTHRFGYWQYEMKKLGELINKAKELIE